MNDNGFRVEIFAADSVGGGPVCTLAAPGHAVPFILHAAWMPRAVPSTARPRTRFADDLDLEHPGAVVGFDPARQVPQRPSWPVA